MWQSKSVRPSHDYRRKNIDESTEIHDKQILVSNILTESIEIDDTS